MRSEAKRHRGSAIAFLAAVALLVAVAVPAAGAARRGGSGGGINSVEPVTDGVTKSSVTIVFPVVDLSAASGSAGLQYISDEKDPLGIHTYVRAFNEAGGVNGRKIKPKIVKFNPLKPSEMRALCKDWTTSGEVFAVLDTGKWHGDNQLCITEEGQLPLISSWTTVTEWTDRGAPYLWWLGPDQADILRNLVAWGADEGLLTEDRSFAVISGDRAGDQLAVEDYLLPALEERGLEPALTATITANIDDPTTAASQAGAVVRRLNSDGIDVVIPLLSVFPGFQSFVSLAKSQDYAPAVLLSDYEQSVNVALGLAESLYPDQMSGQRGPTVYTLSNEDDDRPDGDVVLEDNGAPVGEGYTPEALACWQTYQEQNPNRLEKFPYIEAQGPTMRWCDAINVLKEAMEIAGPKLNRKTFIQALSEMQDFPVALTQTITWGPNDFSGPSTFRVVSPTANVKTIEGNKCPPRHSSYDDTPGDPENKFHGSCWVLIEDWQPLQT
ncbi:MAG: ABC transporter substrate-binding protein [Actinobacteria bacterium]|nr:ABC transporter substrate-binding protein [Actinomycetota bacterium]